MMACFKGVCANKTGNMVERKGWHAEGLRDTYNMQQG